MSTNPQIRNPWLMLTGFAFLLVMIFVIFAFASRTPELVIDERDESTTLTQPIVTVIDPARGADDPVVTIVEFADFSCEACRSLDTALSRLLLLFPDEVRIVWKDAPNQSLHPESVTAAVAARCADEQGQFWSYHDELFLRGALNEKTYLAIANDLELDAEDFASCLEEQNSLPRIQKTLEEASALDLTATPTIFIGEERWIGPLEVDALKTIVEDRLP